MSSPFNEDGSLTCEICGKGLWGGPLGHLDKDWMQCNIKLQERVKELEGELANLRESATTKAQRQMDEFFLKRGSQ